MRTITTQDRQTLFDLAVQYCGGRAAVFQIAELNDLSVTEELPAGFSVIVPEVVNQKIVDYYRINSITPATAVGADNDGSADVENGILSNDGIQLVTNNNTDIKIVTNS